MHIFSLTSEVFRLHLTSASLKCIQQRLSQNSFSFNYVETCPLDDHRTIPEITEGGMLKNTFSHLSYWCHFSSHLTHCPSPLASHGDAVLICGPSSSVFVMKAAEHGEGGLHRSQLRAAGQSEEATPAHRPPQVAEDHQDTGNISFYCNLSVSWV